MTSSLLHNTCTSVDEAKVVIAVTSQPGFTWRSVLPIMVPGIPCIRTQQAGLEQQFRTSRAMSRVGSTFLRQKIIRHYTAFWIPVTYFSEFVSRTPTNFRKIISWSEKQRSNKSKALDEGWQKLRIWWKAYKFKVLDVLTCLIVYNFRRCNLYLH